MAHCSDVDLVRRLVEGFRQTALVATAVQTGLLDALAGEPGSAEQLAKRRQWHGPAMTRDLRGLALLGLVEEVSLPDGPERGYRLTGAGQLLASPSPGPWPHYARLSREQYVPAWMRLDAAVTADRSPFVEAFGASVWDFRRANPPAGALFDQWLHRQSEVDVESIAAACDVAGVETVTDVGGGQGALLAAILGGHPGLRGTLADQPAVIETARETLERAGLLARCATRAIDFFESIPAGAGLYLLKSVLHDWEDDDCLKILRNVRQALDRDARVLIIERILPESPADDPETIWIDLHMLCVTGGRERTVGEYRSLLEGVGLNLLRVIETGGPFHLLEARRA